MIERYIETERLLLRPWETVDAEILFSMASNENLAHDAGWLPHKSVENSREVISNLLSIPGEYAIVSKSDRRIIGAIDLKFNPNANFELADGDSEIGYWLDEKFRGNGYIPEAVNALVEYGFKGLNLNNIWCLCKDSNTNSIRVQEKCGFRYVRNGIINDKIFGKIELRFTCITKDEWMKIHDQSF